MGKKDECPDLGNDTFEGEGLPEKEALRLRGETGSRGGGGEIVSLAPSERDEITD